MGDVTATAQAFVRRVSHALRAKCRAPAGATILLGVSGGADSVAMTRALASAATQRGWRLRLVVGHVNHRLRDAADGDADFVCELAASLGLAMRHADLDAASLGGEGNVEAAARRARYAALAEMAKACSASHVAVAHHADDQLETVLMRLLRGAAIRGMAGMAWRRRLAARGNGDEANVEAGDLRLVRPMLCVDRAAILAYLDAIKQPWCEDHTNRDLTRTRAALRERVLPTLCELRRDAPKRAVALGEHLRCVGKLLDDAVDEAIMQHVGFDDDAVLVDRAAASGLPRVVLAGLLRRLIVDAGAGADRVSRSSLDALARLVRDREGGKRTATFAGHVTATVTRDRIRIARASPGV